jgi:hypothetical protein
VKKTQNWTWSNSSRRVQVRSKYLLKADSVRSIISCAIFQELTKDDFHTNVCRCCEGHWQSAKFKRASGPAQINSSPQKPVY